MEDNTDGNKKTIIPTASAVLEDGTIAEMAFQPKGRRTVFAFIAPGAADGVNRGSDVRLTFSPGNSRP